jgi:type I restriction enzyme R subunit
MTLSPEQEARIKIDGALEKAGWTIYNYQDANVRAARGVAVREFGLKGGYGAADYLLFVNGRAVGVVEAKAEGTTLTGVEIQAEKYSKGFPESYTTYVRPLPFLYHSTGVETRFTNLLDPSPRSRRVFHFHRPETLAKWVTAQPFPANSGNGQEATPSTLRNRLAVMPSFEQGSLWDAQYKAVHNLEISLRDDKPRALIQMATGSG